MHCFRSSLLSAFALLLATEAQAQSNRAAIMARLDSIAGAAVAQNRAVGLVAAVVKGTDTLLLKSYGKADVEWSVLMPTDAVFETGSIAKQFTAAAILQLRDEGKLSLDDDLTKWFPDFDTRGNKVPLRTLLNHTSGIHDLTETREFPALVNNRVYPRDSAYALIRRYPFDFAPGEMQLYSNSGFWLLAVVVEKASGMSYEDYIEKRIFAPLGMKSSMICNPMENIPRRAHGYGLQGGAVWRLPLSILNTWGLGAGGICSTASDMITWLKALHGGKVLSPKSYAEMIAPGTLNNGLRLRYGMGVGVWRDGRHFNSINHGGIVAGFRSEAYWYPESELAIVVLTNTTGGVDPEDVVGQLAAQIVQRPATSAFSGDAAPFVGKYKGRGMNGELNVEITQGPQGILVSGNGSPPRPAAWVEGTTFLFNNFYLTFNRSGSSGPYTELGFTPAKGFYTVLKRQ